MIALLLAFLVALVPTAAPPQPAPSVSVSALHSPISAEGRSGPVWIHGTNGKRPAARGVDAASPRTLSGVASWYDAPTINDAAAGPPLRVGNWRGRLVTVRYGSRSVVVRLSDWCACRGKAIDLDDRAFKQLAPLSVGLLRVTITTGGPALPATDAP